MPAILKRASTGWGMDSGGLLRICTPLTLRDSLQRVARVGDFEWSAEYRVTRATPPEMNSPSSVDKGRLVERVVAELHTIPGVAVERNVRLPALDGSGRKSEIDVLLTAVVAGYPVRLAIECKNEQKRVGTPKINQFVGKLDDVGIPTRHGIYVSTSAYTKGAIKRAAHAGIRTLELLGLATDCLSSVVADVFLSTVYLVAEIKSMLVRTASARGDEGLIYVDSNGNQQSCVPHLFWQQWISGEADAAVGRHSLDLAPPAGLYLCNPNIPAENQLVRLEYHISAFLLSMRGSGTAHALRDAATGAIEKARVEAGFKQRSDSSPLQVFHTEHELQEYVASLLGIQINQRVRVPRIVSGRLYWPPSDEAIERVNKLVEAGFTPSFQQVEGSDLGKAWSGFPQWAIQVTDKKGA